MELTLTYGLALLLDWFLDKSNRYNSELPLRWLATRIERLFYGPSRLDDRLRLLLGVLSVALLVIPIALLIGMVAELAYIGFVVDLGCLYLALGAAQLQKRVQTIRDALQREDLVQARQQVSHLVSRDTSKMTEEDISVATVEVLLTGSCQWVLGPLFWFLVASSPGVVIYCLGNGLAALWGHPTPRYYQFGWAAARLATLLNWLPVRLMAIGYGLWGDGKTARHCWRTQAALWNNANNGVLLAAGAGALQLQLGGRGRYFGRSIQRPSLGAGLLPRAVDIKRTSRLVFYSLSGYFGLMLIAEALLL
jgi:adenosylcobinamide-phosphate synthase